MKQNRTLIYVLAGLVVFAALVYFGRAKTTGPSPSASSSAPKIVTKTFLRDGLRFEYPENYRVEIVTDNPNLHQIAVDSGSGAPGVLTLRFNPNSNAPASDLNTIADEAKRGMGDGNEAIVTPSRLKIGTQEVDARVLKTTILGFPFTDTLALVKVRGRDYLVLMHVADEDQDKAKTMFDKVLSTLGPG